MCSWYITKIKERSKTHASIKKWELGKQTRSFGKAYNSLHCNIRLISDHWIRDHWTSFCYWAPSPPANTNWNLTSFIKYPWYTLFYHLEDCFAIHSTHAHISPLNDIAVFLCLANHLPTLPDGEVRTPFVFLHPNDSWMPTPAPAFKEVKSYMT